MRSILWPAHAEGRWNTLVGLFVFLVSLAVYAWCVTPTVPYWDSGEYIATSYILGIPHPPGTPLYVLIGRLFSMVPVASIAVRVNLLSSVSAAIAVLFSYLIIVRIVRRGWPDAGWMAWVGGIVGAFFMAWSPTFWDNSIEAEVYASASAIMCGCVWLALYWWDKQGEAQNDRFLWLILYILFLAIGIHLGTFLVFPCIYLLVTMVHWDRVRKGAFWGSIGLFLAATAIRLMIVATIDDVDARIVDLSMAEPGTRGTAGLMSLLMLGAVVWNLVAVLGVRFTAGIAAIAVLGVSVHLYLLIRAGLDPAINEGDPSTLHNLWLLLTRDQYKPPEAIFRKAAFGYQFNEMYLRYFRWQFQLADVLAGRSYLVPVALGLFGAIANFYREKKTFWLMATLFLITGPFLVWYLNFKEGEVRERDYFFVANFHFFAIWIGVGAAALLAWARDLLAAGVAMGPTGARPEPRPAEAGAGLVLKRPHPAVVALAFLLVALSSLPLLAGEGNNNLFRHSRRGNFIAHNFAYNMLVGLEPNAILFTNGDNDTFPLWYIQEVEGFRKDVRVLCLSLLNTDWCIRQARDLEPKVPVRMSDAEIEALSPYRDKDGRVVLVKDIMVRHILEMNQWKRPIYLAVTVPDQMGLERQLVMEGLVFRVHPQAQTRRIDTDRARENLNRKYRYEGFLDAAGNWDPTVHKDDQSTRLLQNYAAAYVQLALQLYEDGKLEQALPELERARKMSPYFPGVIMALGYVYERLGQWREAADHYAEQLARYPNDPDLMGQLGYVSGQLGDTARAVELLEQSIRLDPARDFGIYGHLVNIRFNMGQAEAGVQLLEQWLRYHPDDQRARNSLDLIRREMARPDTGGQ